MPGLSATRHGEEGAPDLTRLWMRAELERHRFERVGELVWEPQDQATRQRPAFAHHEGKGLDTGAVVRAELVVSSSQCTVLGEPGRQDPAGDRPRLVALAIRSSYDLASDRQQEVPPSIRAVGTVLRHVFRSRAGRSVPSGECQGVLSAGR